MFANKQDLPGAMSADEIREVRILTLAVCFGTNSERASLCSCIDNTVVKDFIKPITHMPILIERGN